MELLVKLADYKLYIVTGLLILLCYSEFGLYTFILVFTVTTVVTYICYTLNTQLRLDGFFKFLVYFGIGVPKRVTILDEEDYSNKRNHKGLKIFPKPIAKIIQIFIDSIIRDFVKTWYEYLGPDEEDFIAEVRIALEYIVTEIYLQLEKANIHDATVNLIRMFQWHIKVFDDFRNIVQKKYPGISESDFSTCITELYEEGVIKHIATYSKGNEMDYLKTLLDILLFKFLPKDAFSCEGGRFMLREVLAIQLLEPLVKEFTDPHFVNEAIIDILEPSVPLSVVIKAWNDAMKEIENEEESFEVISVSEAPLEDTIEHLEESDKGEMEAVKPASSSARKKSRKENDKELIRFDNLDRSRTSAPVYGSKSARDHEIRIKKPRKTKKSSVRDNTRKNITELDDSGNTSRSLSKEKSLHISSNNQEAWDVCPPSSAKIFRKNSFLEMPRKQDEISEKLKAKVKSIRPTLPTSCLNTCSPGASHSDFQESNITVIEAMPNVDATKKQQTLSAQDNKIEPTLKPKDKVVKIHSSGTDGAFYEVAPSCPTCIEMTLLASPFENDRAQMLLNPKDKVFEHECGLNGEHYYYAETETESNSYEPLDDQSFASCSDSTEDCSDHSYSSGTLLASAETMESSVNYIPEEVDVQSDSYDILSLLSGHSNNSGNLSDNSLSFDDIEDIQGLPKIHRTASVVTFKTAFEHSFSSHKNDDVFTEKRKKSSSSSNKFFKLFKNGLPSVTKNKKTNHKDKSKRHQSKASLQNRKKKGIFKGNRTQSSDFTHFETSSISTSVTKFNSLPDNESSMNAPDSFVENFIEEALEVEEGEEYFDEYAPCGHNSTIAQPFVDPLSKAIEVTQKDLPLESRSVKSAEFVDEKVSVKKDDNVFIPVFEGNVVMPHPSKIPAAWSYPIQMISIPSTEVAYEKGWEPGINKYTLYNIHYDIRIWPDIYQKQLREAGSQNSLTQNEATSMDSVPLIREIKRRYREFLFLHNRLTHGHLAKHMKGILRPNRRYAMPFGRMDPDVIEGRRKILETYLVSLVSRPELCNSREYKEFLGSVDHDDGSVKKIGQRQLYKENVQKVVTVTSVGHASGKYPVVKIHPVSPYFIQGYVVQRMFGYSETDCLERHSTILFTHFVNEYHTLKPLLKTNEHIVASFEPIQHPTFYLPDDSYAKDFYQTLGPRTAGDGAEQAELETADQVYRADGRSRAGTTAYDESSHSINIAAKFSEELAAQLHKEKESLAVAIAREKDLYQSSWPLTDAVLSIACQALKSYGSWLTFGRVQQAILFSLGGVIEWLIGRELNEVLMQERCFKYLKDLYHVVWDNQDKLRESKLAPTQEERKKAKNEALRRIMDIIPKVVMMSVGPNNYRKCCNNLLHTLQYQSINKHVLYAALELILLELIPEFQNEYPQYVETATAVSDNTEDGKKKV